MDNYNQNAKGGARVQASLCDRQIVTELSSDFTLPDYQPEIKRLLRVRATVLPPDKYIGASTADFSGTVDYTVLYCGNDGALYCTAQSEEYHFSAPLEMGADIEVGEGLVCDVDTVTDMAVGRVVAPRKVSLKCRMRSRVRLWGSKILEESVHGGSATERLYGQVDCAKLFVGMGEPLSLMDEILFDAQNAEMRVICAEGQVFVTEATAGSGTVNCRGEVALKLLCADESGGGVTVQTRRIPFAQSVFVDGAEINCDAYADGVCSDLRITVEDGRIVCETTVLLRAHAQRNESVTYTRDLYSTSAVCENTYTQSVFPLAVKCINGNVSVNTTLSLEEVGLRSGASVVDISVNPLVVSVENEHGKYQLNGRCRCHVVYHDGEDLGAQEFEVPFRYETDGGAVAASDFDASVTPIACRARMDSERIGVDAELAVCLGIRGENNIKRLSETKFGEEITRRGAVYTICYPSSDDTLWSVAKRYHRPVTDIAAMNSLAGSPAADSKDSLASVHYLLV